jgi:catechol 2,3-dioxygenase-like lactoylglutathione lyase family enzyme
MIERLDHLVLTVADIEATVAFYECALDMRPERFGEGRVALRFGEQKLNLHPAGREFDPKALWRDPGGSVRCL